MDNKFLSGAILTVLVALTGVTAFKSSEVVVNVPQSSFGVAAGPDVSFLTTFNSSYISGGRVASSTTSTTGTLLAQTIENASTLDYTLNLADATLTFPASSTISFMRNPGDTKVFFVRNSTTTATMDITFAAGTGLNMKRASSTSILRGDADGGNTARVTLIRQSDSDIDMLVDLFVD